MLLCNLHCVYIYIYNYLFMHYNYKMDWRAHETLEVADHVAAFVNFLMQLSALVGA